MVFTTAYAQYALEGFRVNAVDYLLKPFSLQDGNTLPVGESYRPAVRAYLSGI